MELKLKHILRDKDRHGRPRVYVRVHGKPMVRLHEQPGTEAFLQAYFAALAKLTGTKPAPTGKTLEWLGRKYIASTEFQSFKDRDKSNRRGVLDGCFDEPLTPGGTELVGDCPLTHLKPAHVRLLRDRKIKAGMPAAANNRLKYLSAMFAWGIEAGLLDTNPAREVKTAAYEREGYHTWTVDEIRQFEGFWPVDSKPRLAMSLMLFLGLRGGDVRLLGRQHISGNVVRLKPRKTARHRKATELSLPVLPELRKVLDASVAGDLNLIVTEYGQPFTERGFGQWFARQCERAGLPHCTAHGLRKAGATIAAERGATTKQLMAIYGWTTPGQAETYIRSADNRKLAAGAMNLIAPEEE